MSEPQKHIPVLYEELIESLRFFEFGKNSIIDCTLGLAGHASGVVRKLGKWDIFIWLDCDEINLQNAIQTLRKVLAEKSEDKQPTVYCILSNFRDIQTVVQNLSNYQSINKLNKLNKLNELTCVYADLGVSSVHFDTAERGFSFRFDGPLDMRLDLENPVTAKSLINSLEYDKMAEMFRVYGDEPKAGYLTKKILEARKIQSIETTKELSDIITKISRDSLPRVFQALRITVNDEFGALQKMLADGHNLLIPWGTLSIISFHSGEDRIVKHFFREKSTPEKDPITGQDMTPGTLEIITKKPITPSSEEIQRNPRARSALLRVAKKLIR